jgi:hypothetical protein
VTIEVTSTDPADADWLAEVLWPGFTSTSQTGSWQVSLSSQADAYADLCRRRPPHAEARVCFALDTFLVSLPAWNEGTHAVTLADDTRACFLIVAPSRVDLIGDPATRRWRFTAMTVCQEIVAAELRPTDLDVHAAAVEVDGRALLIVGPKGAGKTTLSLHLLRSGRCRSIANDRVIASAGETCAIHGVPTAVRLRPATLAEFPELLRKMPYIERPYLHTLAELAQTASGDERPASVELALSPPQLMRQLNVEAVGSAPLAAVVFPKIRPDVDGWLVEPVSADEVSHGIWANLYGSAHGRRAATVFEEASGRARTPARNVADALARSVPGYRLLLGRRTYDEPEFATRVLDLLLA